MHGDTKNRKPKASLAIVSILVATGLATLSAGVPGVSAEHPAEVDGCFPGRGDSSEPHVQLCLSKDDDSLQLLTIVHDIDPTIVEPVLWVGSVQLFTFTGDGPIPAVGVSDEEGGLCDQYAPLEPFVICSPAGPQEPTPVLEDDVDPEFADLCLWDASAQLLVDGEEEFGWSTGVQTVGDCLS